MRQLLLRVVATNETVGRVTIAADGGLVLDGAATGVFAQLRRRLGDLELGRRLIAEGWSNGYLKLIEALPQ